jgi:tetratricopeptide (TPR) repeat protein
MNLKILLPALLVLWTPCLQAVSWDQDLYDRGLAAYRASRPVEALALLTDLLHRDASSLLAEKTRELIYEIGDRIHQAQEADRMSPAERARLVIRAEALEKERLTRQTRLLNELEGLRRKTDQSPQNLLASLEKSSYLSDAGQVSAVRELEALKAQEYLEQIRGTLIRQLQSGSFSPKAGHAARGFLALYQADLETVVKEWEQALAADPSDKALKANLAKARLKWEEEKKREEIEDALAAGKGFMNAGDYVKAQARFEHVLKISPDHPEAKRQLAAARQRQDDRQRQAAANDMLEDVRRLMDHGSLLDAVPLLVEVLQLNPKNERAQNQLGVIKRKLSARASTPLAPLKPSPAGGAAKTPAAKPGNRGEAEQVYTLGMVSYVEDDLDKAISYFERALLLDPSFQEAAGALDSARREKRLR